MLQKGTFGGLTAGQRDRARAPTCSEWPANTFSMQSRCGAYLAKIIAIPGASVAMALRADCIDNSLLDKYLNEGGYRQNVEKQDTLVATSSSRSFTVAPLREASSVRRFLSDA